jgi:hypothetical protein
MKKITKALIVLHFARTAIALLAQAKAVLAAILANAKLFPAPTPPTAQLSSDIDALDAAETATHTRTKGTVEVRDAKEAIVRADLHLLRSYVQTVADADPANAASIAQAAGMAVRKTPARVTNDLTVKPSKKGSGALDVVARLTATRESHDWQYSTDGGKTWTDAGSTLQARTTITGLVTGTSVLVRHRAVTKIGRDDWSQPVAALVN